MLNSEATSVNNEFVTGNTHSIMVFIEAISVNEAYIAADQALTEEGWSDISFLGAKDITKTYKFLEDDSLRAHAEMAITHACSYIVYKDPHPPLGAKIQ